MKPIELISPADGSVYATRVPLTMQAAEAAVARARAAQKPWAARSLADRIALVKAGVAKLNEMKAQVVDELAWQMGRPTRFGGEYGGVNARTDYMADIAAETLAPKVIEDSDTVPPPDLAREPVGVVFIIAPWNYPLPDHDQHPCPRADRREHGGPETRQPDPPRRRTPGRGLPLPRASPRMCSRMSSSTTPPPKP